MKIPVIEMLKIYHLIKDIKFTVYSIYDVIADMTAHTILQSAAPWYVIIGSYRQQHQSRILQSRSQNL